MDPPELVLAIRESEPSFSRERRVEVVGSNETEEAEKMSRPAKAPARPTLPIRSKSTWGRAARAAWPVNSRAKDKNDVKRFMDESCVEETGILIPQGDSVQLKR